MLDESWKCSTTWKCSYLASLLLESTTMLNIIPNQIRSVKGTTMFILEAIPSVCRQGYANANEKHFERPLPHH